MINRLNIASPPRALSPLSFSLATSKPGDYPENRDDAGNGADTASSPSGLTFDNDSVDSLESCHALLPLADKAKQLQRLAENDSGIPEHLRDSVAKHFNEMAAFAQKEPCYALLLTRHLKDWRDFFNQTAEYKAYFIEERFKDSQRLFRKVKLKTMPKPTPSFIKTEPIYYGLVFLPPGSKLIRKLPISQENCGREKQNLLYSFGDAIHNLRTAIVHSPAFQLSPKTKQTLLRLVNSIERLAFLDADEALRTMFLIQYLTCNLYWPCDRKEMYEVVDDFTRRYSAALASARGEWLMGRGIVIEMTHQMDALRRQHYADLYGEAFASSVLPSSMKIN